jgi:tetratricopeptide (TPR) repeat protein
VFGRLKEQRALEDVLDRVLAGKAHAVAITGEPGIGKTTLLRWASRRATDGSWKVLHARAADHERNVAFSVIVEALDDCVGALEQGRLARLGGEAETELACVFPSLPSSARERRVGTQTERYRLHFAVRRLLEELAGNGPVLVALDDLHWADEASLELVAHLLRRPPRAPVLLLAAYRPRYAPGLLLNALEDARREERCDLLELGPMSPSELEELTGATEADARLALHRESGGNPFYAQQLARGSGPGAVDRRRTSPTLGDVDVPEVVRLAIQRELADLSPTASRFVSACAVAGDPFELDLAVAVAALPEQKALDALDEVLARELVRSTQNPQRFEFRHPIVCHAVYNSAKKSWRVAAHQRASAWLASASRSAAAIAPHIERGVMFVDQAAAEVLRAAGDDAAMRAPAAAAHWYAASLRIAGGADAPPERRVELLIATSAALGAEGRLDESRDCAAEALDAIGTDDIERRVQLASQLAQLDAFRGHPQDARRVLLEALASVPLSMPRQRISLRIELALDRWRTGDTAEAFAEARVALDEARSVKDDRLIGTASALVSLAAMQAGRLAEAERHALAAWW